MSMKVLPKLLFFTHNDDDWTGEEKIMFKLVLPLTNVLIDKYLQYENSAISKDILKALKILVLNNKEKLSKDNFIRLIGPFPKEKICFDELIKVTSQNNLSSWDQNQANKSLLDELKDFVQKTEPRKESVAILLKKLVASTSEVRLYFYFHTK